MSEHIHDSHDVLFVHCAKCRTDKMKVQFSEAHGLVIACQECKTVIFNAQNGEHLDVQLRRIAKQGCAYEEAHKQEKTN